MGKRKTDFEESALVNNRTFNLYLKMFTEPRASHDWFICGATALNLTVIITGITAKKYANGLAVEMTFGMLQI